MRLFRRKRCAKQKHATVVSYILLCTPSKLLLSSLRSALEVLLTPPHCSHSLFPITLTVISLSACLAVSPPWPRDGPGQGWCLA